MKNPYESLGLGKDATDEQIKEAYRREASRTHPDKGGDTAEFQEVSLAYALLSDHSKRDHYDKTGGPPEVDAEQQLLRELAGLFLSVVDQLPDAATVDVILIMDKHIQQHCLQRLQQKLDLERAIKKREVALGRVSHKDRPDNILSAALKADIANKLSSIALLEVDISKGERLIEMLKDYQYRVDAPTIIAYSGFGSGTATRSFL